MGSHRNTALMALPLLLVVPAAAQQAGWHYSFLPGEGDRASMGCARDASAYDFTCLVVRCEDDFSTGLHIYSSRAGGATGQWEMTLDRETRTLPAETGTSPYGAVLRDDDGWLLDGLRHGSFVYLRHTQDMDAEYNFIDLSGSLRSIAEALYWCAPPVPQNEQIGNRDVGTTE
ncbi:hypothetical protein [Devosia sp. CAU 1758]